MILLLFSSVSFHSAPSSPHAPESVLCFHYDTAYSSAESLKKLFISSKNGIPKGLHPFGGFGRSPISISSPKAILLIWRA